MTAGGHSAPEHAPPSVHVALNGARTADEHPAIPRTPDELAEAGQAAVEAGAELIHLHAYDEQGVETLAAGPCADALRAVRASCPGIPISMTTWAGLAPDPWRRIELIASWTELPDVVTANQGEAGILELCAYLVSRGIGIEAGLLSLADAQAFVRAGITERCARVLVEPLDAHPARAVAHAAAMEDVLSAAGITLGQVHHGDGVASWAVNKRALTRGHGIRTGLEDTTVLPDGRLAPDNAALVRAAVALSA